MSFPRKQALLGSIGFVAAAAIAIPHGTERAHATAILMYQSDGSAAASVQTSCDNRCSNLTVGAQAFVPAASGTIGTIEVFTRDFGSNSKYPEGNTCYLTLYNDATGEKIATSDNTYYGYGCAGDLRFTFKDSRPMVTEGSSYRWEYVFGAQNFSRISFLGSASDTVEGAFRGSGIADAEFSIYADLEPPAVLGQSAPDGNERMSAGGVVTITDSTAMLTATLPSPLPDILRLEAELQPSFIPFTGIPNLISAFTLPATSSPVSTNTPALPNGAYHWRARSADKDGNTSSWVAPKDPAAEADVFIEDPSAGIVLEDAATPYAKDARPNPCFDDGTLFSCALIPTSTPYKVPGPFTLSSIAFDWHNDGANNCDDFGHYRAAIAGEDPGTIIATSSDSTYLGCANTGGTAELHFASATIPADFHFTLDADDGLQGGAHVNVSRVRFYGTFQDGSSTGTDTGGTAGSDDGATSSSTPSSTVPVRHPVVIVPGILGSKLAKEANDAELWPNADMMIASPSDTYLDPLALDPSGGERPGNELYASDILRTVTTSIPLVHEDVYRPLIDALEGKGYREGADLFPAPYDWRLGIARAADAIAPVIRRAIAASADGTIDIIAHSMGGLVAKEYLAAATGTPPIGKLILVGTPQLGAPEMFKTLNYGDDLGFRAGPWSLLAPREVKSIAQNMPSVYELLPSSRYLEIQGDYVIDNRFGAHAPLDYEGTAKAMRAIPSDTRNADLLELASEFHTARDIVPASAQEVYDIVGCQNPATPAGFVLQDGGGVETVRGSGDGTVPIASALNLANGYHTYFSLYFENGADHMGLVRAQGPLALIGAILADETSSLALEPLGISSSTKDCLEGRSSLRRESTIEISATGPVVLDAYDAQGRHTGGSDTSGSVAARTETGIPASEYETWENGRTLMLPSSGTYRVALSPSATGTFTLKMNAYDDAAQLVRSVTYIKVPLASASSAMELAVDGPSAAPSLTLADAAGTAIIAPTAALSSTTARDITPPIVTMAEIPDPMAHDAHATLSFSTQDDESGIATSSATLDGIPIRNHTVIQDLTPGIHEMRIEAVDNAGNPRIATSSFTVLEGTISTPPQNPSEGNGDPDGRNGGGSVDMPSVVNVPSPPSSPSTSGTAPSPPRHCRPRPRPAP